MVEGQCLCGAVSYRYYLKIEKSMMCFCEDCQRAQGAFGGWNSPINANQLEIISGKGYLKEYFHSALKARVFCSKCASPIYSYRKDLENIVRFCVWGTVTQGAIPKPTEFAYLENKLAFINIIA